jgi:hypothetical protein
MIKVLKKKQERSSKYCNFHDPPPPPSFKGKTQSFFTIILSLFKTFVKNLAQSTYPQM